MKRVSVVMAVYNGMYGGMPYLKESVESILCQSFRDFEFIIVDDASTDATPQFLQAYRAKDPRIVLLRNPENIGLTRSLNRGFQAAQEEYIVRQDDDDISCPERLEVLTGYLDVHPEIGVLGSAYRRVDAQGREIGLSELPGTDTEIRWRMLFNSPFAHVSIICRKSICNFETGVYDVSFRYAQDYELWTRLLQKTRGANIPEPLMSVRIRGDSTSGRHFEEQQRLASSIVQRELRKLGFDLLASDIETLRRWNLEGMDCLDRDGGRLCRILLLILNAFSRQAGLDIKIVDGLRKHYVHSMIGAVSRGGLGAALSSGLAWDLFKTDTMAVIARAFHGVWRRR